VKFKEGLMIEYPKGLKALLFPLEDQNTFLVEDVNEIIRLDKKDSEKTASLKIIGYTK
jgi:hypothetical protein